MKILIVGDTHIGGSYSLARNDPNLHINTRLIDYCNTLERTIDMGAAMGAEEMIFTGDIFEHRHPSNIQQKMFSQALDYAKQKGIQRIHIIVGNHDQTRIGGATTISYLKELNLPHIRVYEEMDTDIFSIHGTPMANFIFMPYRDRLWLGVDTYTEAIDKMRALLNAQIDNIENNLPVIVVGHMTIEGTFFSDEYKDLYSENQLNLPIDMFDRVNLTLMGHIHKPDVVSTNPYIAYVGSMEKRGGFEDHDKVFAILDLEKTEVSYHKEPCREIYDIELDYTVAVIGDGLMKKIKDDIDAFSKRKELAGSIVKMNIKICAEDDVYVDTKILIPYIKEKYKVYYCTEIKKDIFSPRQSRDDRITENITDSEALRLFLINTVDDTVLRNELFDSGVDIIRSLEGVDASN